MFVLIFSVPLVGSSPTTQALGPWPATLGQWNSKLLPSPKQPNISQVAIREYSQVPPTYWAIMTSWEHALHPLFWHSFGYDDRMAVTASNESKITQPMHQWCHKNIHIAEEQAALFYFLTPSLDTLQQWIPWFFKKKFGTKTQTVFHLSFRFQKSK